MRGRCVGWMPARAVPQALYACGVNRLLLVTQGADDEYGSRAQVLAVTARFIRDVVRTPPAVLELRRAVRVFSV